MSFFKAIGVFFMSIGVAITGWFSPSTPSTPQSSASAVVTTTTASSSHTAASAITYHLVKGQKAYSNDELIALAENTTSNTGSVPLGDYKYVTTGAKKGYVYLCNVHKDNPGSMVTGPWVHGASWNWSEKVSVEGNVSWPTAQFSNAVSGNRRLVQGNDLPINHTTGVFPVQSSDPAASYDPNPSSIKAQTLTQSLPATPTYSATPYCMGGEVGVMLSGVPLFNAFDAGLRDAPAHELQDSCSGHPQGSGEYHYHSMPNCFKDVSVSTVLGYALDGFPITGPKVTSATYLTTEDLDECHGLTSEVTIDGKKTVTYHYVMTKDFPYSASCFRGKPASMMVIQSSNRQTSQIQTGTAPSGTQTSQTGHQPPQEAIDACVHKSVNDACSISTPNGMLSGTCKTPPNASLACVPNQ